MILLIVPIALILLFIFAPTVYDGNYAIMWVTAPLIGVWLFSLAAKLTDIPDMHIEIQSIKHQYEKDGQHTMLQQEKEMVAKNIKEIKDYQEKIIKERKEMYDYLHSDVGAALAMQIDYRKKNDSAYIKSKLKEFEDKLRFDRRQDELQSYVSCSRRNNYYSNYKPIWERYTEPNKEQALENVEKGLKMIKRYNLRMKQYKEYFEIEEGVDFMWKIAKKYKKNFNHYSCSYRAGYLDELQEIYNVVLYVQKSWMDAFPPDDEGNLSRYLDWDKIHIEDWFYPTRGVRVKIVKPPKPDKDLYKMHLYNW